jgi:predicted nucleic acid-binding protein
MINVLIDTNVALDILLNRQPHYINTARIYRLTENNVIRSFISASAITDIFFLAKSHIGKKPTKEALKKLLNVFRPATVTDSHIFQALNLDWDDFEDSVQYVVGKSFSAHYIVTRNVSDYSSGSIPAVAPEQFIKTATVIIDE